MGGVKYSVHHQAFSLMAIHCTATQ